MLIRPFRVGDEPELLEVFLSAIHGIAAKDYTPEQVAAWASVTPAQWAGRMQGIAPFVVECDGKLIAYADVQQNGYIDHFYVSAPFARRGVGSMLMRRLHDEAAAKGMRVLTSEVSRTAQPFFHVWGFSIVQEQQPVVRGIVVPNALMKKPL